ncbi:hypothetical protein D9M68_785800 [compost metagenome]
MQLVPELHQVRQPIIQGSARVLQQGQEFRLIALCSSLGGKSLLADSTPGATVLVEVSRPGLTVLACRHTALPHLIVRSVSSFWMCL